MAGSGVRDPAPGFLFLLKYLGKAGKARDPSLVCISDISAQPTRLVVLEGSWRCSALRHEGKFLSAVRGL